MAVSKKANPTTLLIVSVLLVAIHCATAVGRPIYVDADAPPGGDGASWATAYKYLQDALTDANSDPDPNDIWMAEGVYTPDTNSAEPNGTGDRKATFQLISGVALYGGFSSGGSAWSDRDPNIYPSILSGDLDGNDVDVNHPSDLVGESTLGENSYSVVTGSGTDATAVLDGLTITSGNANLYSVPDDLSSWGGGGMYNDAGSPALANCAFRNNRSFVVGGGMCNYNDSNPTLTNCTFSGNVSHYAQGDPGMAGTGGGMSNYSNSNPTLIDCSFTENFAWYSGGMSNLNSSPTLVNCTFRRNIADNHGGAMGNEFLPGWFPNTPCKPTLVNCVFIGNSADYSGGGVMNWWSQTTFTNCTFTGNRAPRGGAMFNTAQSTVVLTNCTLNGNSANRGGGIYEGRLYSWSPPPQELILSNCILWGNTANQGMQLSLKKPGDVSINHCDIQGGHAAFDWGEGNVNTDPLLTPDGHLKVDSPCIGAGDPNFVPDPNAPTDIDGEDRVVGGRVDIGADEFLDSDGDSLPDFWELRYFDSVTGARPHHDKDHDGLSNLQEYELYSSNPIAQPYWVNLQKGNDAYDGLSRNPRGNTNIGPKKTIQAAIDAAGNGDTILVMAGTYTGPNNIDLDFGGKSIILRALSRGTNSTVIDCQSQGRAFDFHSGETAGTAVVGFTITNGHAVDPNDEDNNRGGAIRCIGSSPQIRDCTITNNDANDVGGGIYCYLSNPVFASCNITDNSPDGIWMEYGGARIDGIVELSGNDWFGSEIMLYGDGAIQMDSTVTLYLVDSRIRGDIVGPGTIQVPLESELIIENDAIIDLYNEADPDLNGQILCDGLLRLRDEVTIIDAQVYVSRASFEDDVIILNSVVSAEAGAPYGQFFIEGNIHLWLDRIVSDGDRYLDLGPNDCNLTNIHVDAIDVNITEGTQGTRGGLFELRGEPNLVNVIDCCEPNNPFFCRADYVPPFDTNNWTVNRLELVEDAKLNLTNRFDFQ
jgi:hypothetical protein